MKSIAILLSLTLCCLEWTTCLGAVIYDTNDTLVAPGSVLDARYSLTRDFCWLLAHTSIRVGDTIIIDGGMAKYKIQKDGKDKRVLDFNFETLSLDLTQDFDVNDLGNTLNVLTERPANNPPTNRGGMWTDGVNVWVQGGHFYAKTPYYNTSRWFVKTEDIPPYGIWKFSKQNGWEQEKGYKVQDGSVVERTVSGAAACTNETCYWVGGYVNSRTSPPSSGTSPLTKWSAGRRGMLVFDLATKSLKNESMADYTSTDPEYGFHFGTLQHFLSSDKQKGLLLSLMAEKSLIYPANDSSSSDDPYDPLGTPLNDAVMLYDIEMDKWHKQPAVSYTGNDPPTRSRFCGVLAHDVESKNWDLWLFGGQRINDTSTGVDDIYVLTMPAFIWVRVSVVWTTSETPDYLRSMTCHTVGSQLLVIGGLAPGREREERIPCNKRLVNVLDLNNPNGWASSYSANPPAYKQPEVVRKAAAGIAEPRAQSGWAHPRLKQLFDEAAAATSPTDSSIPNPTRTAAATSSSSPPAAGWSKGQIAGVIVGVVIGTAIIVGGAVILFMRRRRFQQALASTEPSEGSQEGRPELRAELSTHPPVIGSPVSAQHQTPEPETPQNPPPQEISSAPINNRGPPPPIPPNRPDSTVNT